MPNKRITLENIGTHIRIAKEENFFPLLFADIPIEKFNSWNPDERVLFSLMYLHNLQENT